MRLFPVAFLVLLAACDGGPLIRGTYTGEAQIEQGSTVLLNGLAVSFDRVVEDSRCPEDVTCIWAGEATVALSVEGAHLTFPVVDRDSASTNGVLFGDVALAVVDLLPYPRQENPSDATPVVTVIAHPLEG